MADIHHLPASEPRTARQRLSDEVRALDTLATAAVSEAVRQVAGNDDQHVARKAVAKAAVLGLIIADGTVVARNYINLLFAIAEDVAAAHAPEGPGAA